MRALPPLFLLSGASALIYQVSWARGFGLLFGNTVQSAAAVTGGFWGGGGGGAGAAGAWVDRRPGDALRAYGAVELAVAAWGLALAVGLPGLSLTPAWAPGPEGWLWPADLGRRIALAVALVLPPAALMGSTVSLLAARALAGHTDAAGWRVGLLMAANTAGAAAGALACDLWLVPAAGVMRAQLVAVGLNLCAGALALTLPRAPPPAAARATVAGRPPGRFALSLSLGGAAAMGLEVLWLRFLGSALGGFRAVLAMTLACGLVGLWAGSLLAAALTRRGGRPAALLAGAQAAVAALALGAFALYDPHSTLEAQLALPPLASNLAVSAGLVLPASIAMGMAYPLANAAVQGPAGEVGRRAGALFAAGAAGNLLGALGAGFALLPMWGMQGCLMALGALAVLAAAAAAPQGARWVLAPGVLALAGFALLPPGRILERSFPAGRLAAEGALAVAEGVEQTLVITGDPEGPARLWTSGHPMSSTSPHAQRYMRFMAHLPLLLQPAPRRALVICFGVGNTTHAASLHPSIEALHVADLSPTVLRQAGWFAHANRGVLSDPRVTVFVDDGRRVLAAGGPDYDLITLEPPPIAYAGVSSLYSRELYQAALARLAPGGFVSQWVPGYQVPGDVVESLMASFVAVFPDALLFVADRKEMVLIGRRGGIGTIAPEALQALCAAGGGAAADLAAIGLPDAAALIGRFAGADLGPAVASAPPVTDDDPRLEYAQASQVTRTRLPPALFDPAAITGWCPACPIPEADYTGEAFLRFSNLPEDTQ